MMVQNFLVFALANLILPVFSNIQGSIPVCPSKYYKERDHHYPYVVYGTNPPQCYVASRQGPCDSGSVLFAKPNSPMGICSCKCFLSEGIVFDGSSVNNYRYCLDSQSGQTYVFDRSRESCYRLGSQGPCPHGQVLYKDIYSYDFNPKCVREDISSSPHTPIQGNCPEGEIYSELLERCTDMNFHGLNQTTTQQPSEPAKPCNHTTTTSTTPRPTQLPVGKCPPGTIISTLLNKCVDMNFKGQGMGWGSTATPKPSTQPCNHGTTQQPSTQGKCPPGTIYSTLLNRCVDMNFKGQGMGWNSGVSNGSRKCRQGMEIYSTLLNRCVDMSFRGLRANKNQIK